jgi:endoglycosylceramidase
LRDKFAAFWGEISRQFGESDNIIGYELLNEPWCGNIYEQPDLLVPGVADKEKLQPMYD